jgi:hypothetical protein
LDGEVVRVFDEPVVFEETDVAEGGGDGVALLEGEFAEAFAGDFGFEVFMRSRATRAKFPAEKMWSTLAGIACWCGVVPAGWISTSWGRT